MFYSTYANGANVVSFNFVGGSPNIFPPCAIEKAHPALS